ncbi:pyridoxamine 5'-phosphate oxidase family protein [Acidothermaceae bacterium B102]|nr:pyridoxamine 5'-phosphate oxidase family protein [Acidothermaceae bacterium B102]
MVEPPADGPSSPRSRVKRQPQLAAYDRRTINAILDAGIVGHLAVVDEAGQPYALPLGYARDGDAVLLHGSTASRVFRLAASGAPVCLTVTLFDGIVFARSVFNSSIHYRSVVVLGRATPVADDDKTEALRVLSERLAPGHWDAARQPSAQELKATSVLRLSLTEASAKISTGPPEDEPADLALDVWAGVVPVEQLWGKPEPAPELAPGRPVPSYVLDWRPELRPSTGPATG